MHRALIAVASLSLVACRGDRATAHKVPADAEAATAAVGPPSRIIDPPTVLPLPRLPTPRLLRDELVDAGRGPRRTLRYHLEATARSVVATARITSHTYDVAWADPIALAPVIEGFEVAPTASGPIQVRGLPAELVRDGQAAPAIRAAEAYLTRWRTLLERRRADLTVDDRGRFGELTLLADPAGANPDDVRDELVQRWVGLAVPLPEAAVGIGARWKVVTMLRTGGAAVTQTASYHLTAIEGDRWELEVQLDRLGRPQDIDVPGLPAGTTAQLVALVRKVKGTITVSATCPLPIAGTLTAEVRSQARFVSTAGVRDQYSEDQATITLSSTP